MLPIQFSSAGQADQSIIAARAICDTHTQTHFNAVKVPVCDRAAAE
jgi:hypothetical protein